MYQIVKAQSSHVLARETVPLAAAFVVAEVFYEFHSFALECIAFLATWYALSWVADRFAPARPARDAERPR
jgi:hypothetical protein